MDGTPLLIHKGAIEVSGSDKDSTSIDLDCGGRIRVEETPIDGLRIMPSGRIRIGDMTFDLEGKDL